MKKYSFLARAALLAVLALLVPACGDDDDDAAAAIAILTTAQVEPDNDAIATATPVGSSKAGAGDLTTAGDVDFWSFDATAGDVIEIEAQSYRCNQTAWTTPGNRLAVTVIAPDTTTQLVINIPFISSPLDQDISLFRIAATGTHYLRLSQLTPANAAGLYAFTIKTVTIPGLQVEAEVTTAPGANDVPGGAELVVPGTIFGIKEAGAFDFYKFDVTAPSIFQLQTIVHRNGAAGAAVIRFDPIIDLIATDEVTLLKSVDDNIYFDSGFAYQINTPGTYFIRVNHFNNLAFGPYFMTFSLTPIGAVVETEPNNTAFTANPIAYGAIVNGVAIDGDNDLYTFTGTAGDMVNVQFLQFITDVQGAAAGTTTTATILGLDGATPVPAAGEGSNLRIRRTILTASGTYYVRVSTNSVPARPYVLVLSRVQSSDMEVEPNNTPATATPFPGGGKVTGVISTAGDLDTYGFSAGVGELVIFSVQANTANSGNLDGWGSTLNPTLTLLDGTGAPITSATGTTRGTISGQVRVEVSLVAPAGGNYYVQVSDAGAAGGPTRYYTLNKR